MALKPKTFLPENRLDKVVSSGRAPSFAELLRSAEAGLLLLAPDLAKDLAASVAQIVTLSAQDQETIKARAPELMKLAKGIADVAVGADFAALGEVGRGLVVLLQAQQQRGVWRHDVYMLHVDALRLVQNQGGGAAAYRKMIANLLKVRETMGILE